MSKRFILILTFFLINCESELKKFRIDNFSDYLIINLDSTRTVEDLESFYCQQFDHNRSIKLILPYDFKTSQLKQDSDFGIPVIGHPMKCSEIDCCKQSMNFVLDSTNNLYYRDSLVTTDDISELIKLNIFNHGNLPELSNSPDKALFQISAPSNLSLSKISQHAGMIALKFQEHAQLDNFNLIITKHIDFTNPEFDVDDDEIIDELEIDMHSSS